MHATIPLLQGTALFKGFADSELQRLLPMLAPARHSYAAGQVIWHAGSTIADIGIVLEGAIEAVKYTRAGEQFIVTRMGPGGVFGDVLSGSHTKSPVTLRATGACAVLLLPLARLLAPPPGQDALFRPLMQNLVGVISNKYFALDARIDLLLTHPLRRRVAAFLLDAAGGHPRQPFTLPYNRAQLAAYLGCERSALSRELSRMAKEGLIEVTRSTFRLPNPAAVKRIFMQ